MFCSNAGHVIGVGMAAVPAALRLQICRGGGGGGGGGASTMRSEVMEADGNLWVFYLL